jgi:methyl-accepting chemotaxis protein
MANTETLLMIFIGITAVAVLLQAGVLLGIFLTVRKAVEIGKEQADEYRAKLTPIIDGLAPIMHGSSKLISTANDMVSSAQSLITTVRPHLEFAATELANMATEIHAEANQLQASVDEVAQKARQQVDRVDSMATSVLNGLDRFGGFLNEALHLPIRQVNGIVAAARAVMETLRATGAPRPPRRTSQPTNVAEDKDLFV